MDKRFLYLILVIAIILVVVLAYQDSGKINNNGLVDKINATPTLSLEMTPAPTQPINNINQPAAQASQAAVVELEGGLKVQDLAVGTGKEAKAEDTIAVNYVGYLENGQKFDSSYDRKKPFILQVGVGQVIKGWDLGIIGMKEGGKRRLFIPSALGYGEQGAGNVIPPNANLIFDVELLSIK
jgi:peptidylprolyl isomerase